MSSKIEPTLQSKEASQAQKITSILAFPLTMSLAIGLSIIAMQHSDLSPAVISGLAVLVFGFLIIPCLEWLAPFREAWSKNDHDVLTDTSNLLINSVVTTIEKPILVVLLVSLSAHLSEVLGNQLWPDGWPLIAQLFLMLVIAEFGRYWVHFAAHKVPYLWRLHAVHHSPNRLYFLNAGRFHPLEKVLFQLPEVVPFILLGTNVETIALYFVFNSVHGLFQHSNIRLKLGPLNYIFSMTELHRWHHSKRIEESDRNFGNNLIIWDLIFGTYYNPKDSEVADIGLINPDYPRSYLGQLRAPFANKDLSKTK